MYILICHVRRQETFPRSLIKNIKREPKNFFKKLTSYAIIFGQMNFFFIIRLVVRVKREFCLFYSNAILKDRVLIKYSQ